MGYIDGRKNNYSVQYVFHMWTPWEDSRVITATGYEPAASGSIPERGKKYFSTPQRPYRLWGPFCLHNLDIEEFSIGVKVAGS
jgi:hypothetical protein